MYCSLDQNTCHRNGVDATGRTAGVGGISNLLYAKDKHSKVEVFGPVVFHFVSKHPDYKPLVECSPVYVVKASLGKEIGNPYCAIAMADDLAAASETCRNILAAT